jgi:hypothetical protein
MSFALHSSETNSIVPEWRWRLPRDYSERWPKVILQCGMFSQAVAFNSDSSLAFPEVVEICLKAVLLRIWNDQSDDP